jgi:hypothetical protein
LDELTKGTQEWRDAMFEANEQAKELIDKYGDKLSSRDYYFEDGQIKFREGALEKLQEEEFNTMMKA